MDGGQSGLIYYMLEELDALFAYGECYEFFERYDKESDSWRPSKISYSQFLHDFDGKVVDECVARVISGGNLPYKKYEEYCCMIGSFAKSEKERNEI